MAKLFITLYLMVLASFGLFFVIVGSLGTLGESVGEASRIEEKISSGVFQLLNESVQDIDIAQRKFLISDYKKTFGDDFELTELSVLNLTSKQKIQLDQGRIVSVEEDLPPAKSAVAREKPSEKTKTILYHKLADTSLVWRLHLDTDVSTSIDNTTITTQVIPGKFSTGMMYLLESKLLPLPEDKWLSELKHLQPRFGLTLNLHDLAAITHKLDNKSQMLTDLAQGKVMNITQYSKYATFVYQIPNTRKVLQVGPITVPWFYRNAIYLMFLIFALSLATALFLWVRPLWSNLIKIKQAADDFGSGHYETRIPYKKRSPIAKVTKAFNAMAERTQSSIRSQKELTTAVSHELRTPVARMRFALEMLSNSSHPEDKKRFINDIDADINELDSLLEELLTYARFDQTDHAINVTQEKLLPWLNTCLEKLAPLAHDKTLIHSIENINTNETALIEPRLMSRALDNLVQNALRYAKQTINITLRKESESYLLIVEDDGFGIPEEERANIFDAFTRIDASRDRASGGFGLGLAIVDRIVKGHQGSISLHDSPLGGARFEVRFPRY